MQCFSCFLNLRYLSRSSFLVCCASEPESRILVHGKKGYAECGFRQADFPIRKGKGSGRGRFSLFTLEAVGDDYWHIFAPAQSSFPKRGYSKRSNKCETVSHLSRRSFAKADCRA